MSETAKLLEYRPTHDSRGAAQITVDTRTRAPQPVTPLLFGKFCEHLGSNIYHGMEAQILFNCTFSKWRFSAGDNHPDGGVREESDTERITQRIQARAQRMNWPNAEPVRDAYFHGGAYGWFRIGPRESVTLSPEVGLHGQRAQRIETRAGDGIGQWTYLPLHRTRGFDFHIVARAISTPTTIHIALMPLDGAAKVSSTIELSSRWQTLTGHLSIPSDWPTDALYQFAITADTDAHFLLDRVMLYPEDHVDGADPDVVRLFSESKLPLLRWPGGNFVSGYHWRGGVGPVDARPTVPNPAWEGMEFNTFGTDEFIQFCRNVGCEPMICVNAGDGGAEEAADWVEYCNGAPNTPMGRLRAENGHPDPYNVRYWEIGNEIYGHWQVGWTTAIGNVDRYLRFRDAMLERDASIHIIGCGEGNVPNGVWNQRLITGAVGELQSITDHILTGGSVNADTDPVELYQAFLGYATELERRYDVLRRSMLDAGIAQPHLAITELQLFAHFHGAVKPDGKLSPATMPRQDSISEALYYTTIINSSIRLGDFVEMVTHSATLNHGGGLRKERERVYPNPIFHARAVATELAGGRPVAVRLTCESYDTTHSFGAIPALKDVPVLDPMAVLTQEGDLLLLIVHRGGPDSTIQLSIELGGFVADSQATVSTLSADAWFEGNTLQEPDRIVPQRQQTPVTADGHLALTLSPFSLTLVRVSSKR